MKFRNFLLVALSILLHSSIQAQMVVGTDTLYGNEWINYNQSYYKISIGEDGMYKISYSVLSNAGVFSGGTTPKGKNFQLFHRGKQVPIFVTNAEALGTSDHIEFFATKNRGELDSYLYPSANDQTNTEYSMFSDTSAYFLTWDNGNSNNTRFVATNNDLSNPPAREQYFWNTQTLTYKDKLYFGKKYGGGGSYSSQYDVTEGFANTTFNNNQTYNLAAPFLYASGPNSKMQVRFFTEGGNHNFRMSANNVAYLTQTHTDWAVKNYSIDVPSNTLNTSSNALKLEGTASANDNFAISSIQFKYPREFNLENNNYFVLKLDASASAKYLEIQNFDAGGANPILYDLTNNLRIETTLSGSTIRVLIPASGTERTLVLLGKNGYKNIAKAEKRNFFNFNANSGKYIMLTHEYFFNDGNGNNYVQDYANYRASAAGGNLSPIVVEIQQVYDQFGYGVAYNPVSIRNFTHFAIKNWASRYLFIIGKGIYYEFTRTNRPMTFKNHVPSYGQPQSDHLFGASSTTNNPKIGIGRIAPQTHEQLAIYLNKVKEYESAQQNPQTIADRAWMKKVLHLGGGDLAIQSLIKNELEDLKVKATNSTFGAEVTSFYKTSTDPVQNAQTEELKRIINNGTSLISFFGHSAPSTWDFDLGRPSDYNNKGKYPIMYAIGCHTNRIFENPETLSEDWVLTADRGGIAFIGATWETTLSNLSTYAKYFYQNLFTDKYGERLGDVMKETISDFSLTSSFYSIQVKQVLIIHGDPGLSINPRDGADYIPDVNSVVFNPTLINAQQTKFELSVDIYNIGSAVTDSIDIKIEHEFPNGTIVTPKQVRIPAPLNKASLTLEIPILNNAILGQNKLHITADAGNDVAERPNPQAELNNKISVPFYVLANDAYPVYPPEFSIVPNQNLVLKASSANAFAARQKYFIELDTTETFNSPLKKSSQVTQLGGLIKWQPNITYQDSVVYYWRVSVDSTQTNGQGFNWHTSSFMFLSNSFPGWNQSHYYQYKKDAFDDIDLPESKRKFKFSDNIKEIKVYNTGYGFEVGGLIGLTFNSDRISQYLWGITGGISVNVFNPIDLSYMVNYDRGGGLGDHGSYIDQYTASSSSFLFRTDTPAERAKAINFLQNVVPNGHYVLIHTIQQRANSFWPNLDYTPELWAADSISTGTNLFQVLEAAGASKIRQTIDNTSPYFFFYKKGTPNFNNEQEELVTGGASSVLEKTFSIVGSWNEGTVESTKIGPASAWGSFHWQLENYEAANDNVFVALFGIKPNGEKVFLQNIPTSTPDVVINNIDANQYPYLQLLFNSKDNTLRTSPHLHYWRVLYDPLPEAALNPNQHLVFLSDTLQVGQPLQVEVAIENIGQVNMDSMLVYFTAKDANNNTTQTQTRTKPLLVGNSIIAKTSINSLGIQGLSQFIIDANPNNDQPELTHVNNIGIRNFYAVPDNKNPILDVTFNGLHIMDGDIVSAKPEILMTLLDESQFLLLNDTSYFDIYLKKPAQGSPDLPISVDGNILTFFPADGTGQNKAKMLFKPELLEDGVYELTVQGRDATGNLSGAVAYKVRFEVVNQQSISNVLNYPNPFSTSTQFVFTVTGEKMPEYLKIQVMTVSGKIVREITMDELGPLRIGHNITDFKWDGTDEYGEKLANGVYLYRVITKDETGKDYEKYENANTSQYFKKDLGKLVILR